MIITRIVLLVAGWYLGHVTLGAAWGPVVAIFAMTVGFLAEAGLFMIKHDRLDKTLQDRKEKEKKLFPGAVFVREMNEIELQDEARRKIEKQDLDNKNKKEKLD